MNKPNMIIYILKNKLANCRLVKIKIIHENMARNKSKIMIILKMLEYQFELTFYNYIKSYCDFKWF